METFKHLLFLHGHLLHDAYADPQQPVLAISPIAPIAAPPSCCGDAACAAAS